MQVHSGLLGDVTILKMTSVLAIIRGTNTVDQQDHGPFASGVPHQLCPAMVFQHLLPAVLLSILIHKHNGRELGSVPLDVHAGCPLLRGQLAGQSGVCPWKDQDEFIWSLHRKPRLCIRIRQIRRSQ